MTFKFLFEGLYTFVDKYNRLMHTTRYTGINNICFGL